MTLQKQEPAADRAHGLGNVDQLGGKIGMEFSASPDVLQGEAIFHEGQHLGFIVIRADGFDAITGRGVALGRFNDAGAAARALLARSVPPIGGVCG